MILYQEDNLVLDLQKTQKGYWLNIMRQNGNSDSWYVIAGFEKELYENSYNLKSIGDRISLKGQHEASNLMALINEGFRILKEFDGDLVKIYKHYQKEQSKDKIEEIKRSLVYNTQDKYYDGLTDLEKRQSFHIRYLLKLIDEEPDELKDREDDFYGD